MSIMERQIYVQNKLAQMEIAIEESRKTLVDVYSLAISQGLEDKTGVVAIAITSFSTLMDKYTELCKDYSKLLTEIENL